MWGVDALVVNTVRRQALICTASYCCACSQDGLRFDCRHELDREDSNVKKPIPMSTGFNSWLNFAIATMDARGAFLDHLFTDDIPTQDEIRAAAKAELDALRAKAAS